MTKTKNTTKLKGMTLQELKQFFEEIGEPSYRGEQLFRWMYEKQADSIKDVTTFSKSLRDKLQKYGSISRGKLIEETGDSAENTVKLLVEMEDGMQVEAVHIPEKDRVTVCLSSQVGCAIDCDFCATGKMGFHRHLDAGEIFEQFRLLQQFSDRPITNIVFMGMGEPFHNYDQVLKAADIFNHDMGPNIGRNRITISTSGILPRIFQYTNEDRPYKLAISLNGTIDEIRSQLMPLNQRWPIKDLLNAAKRYTEMTKNRITFEYVLIKDYTDSIGDAKRLKSMLKDINCKLNVIPFNQVGNIYKRPSDNQIETFLSALHPTPFPLTVRWSRGHDINAACGQLSTKHQTKKKQQTSRIEM
jgi:23S rRNA (adenine2503-C2)-methyltransferase